MKNLVEWIICCVVLHNLLAQVNDQWAELVEDNSDESDPPELPENLHDNNTTTGIRENIWEYTLSYYSRQHSQ